MKVKFLKMRKGAHMPTEAHKDRPDFCCDLVAVDMEKDGDYYKYYLGFAIQIDREYEAEKISDGATVYGKEYARRCEEVYVDLKSSPLKLGFMLFPRSSVFKHGMILTNGVGVVDEGYTGELAVVFYHIDKSKPPYKVGDKVCQMSLMSCFPIQFSSAAILDETERGDEGYGSTDVKK